MKDSKDQLQNTESQSYLDRLETATPTQASQSVIAQILLKLKKKLK